MTTALARAATPARLPARADASRSNEHEPAHDAKPPRNEGAADGGIREGVRELEPKDPAARDGVRRAAKARPGAGVSELEPPKPTKSDREATRLADRADWLFEQLVQQRDIIRDAVEFGDTGAAVQAFAKARELFAQIVEIGNEAQINVSSSTDSDTLTDAKDRIANRVKYAYEWAHLIEEAMPGSQTL